MMWWAEENLQGLVLTNYVISEDQAQITKFDTSAWAMLLAIDLKSSQVELWFA